MNELSLFTGAGGGLLGTKLLGFRAIGYVENNPYCQKVLKARIADGILDEAPIFGDIRKFINDGFATMFNGMAHVVTAGFPCQPFSVAGKGLAENDPRNMWPETIEVIRKIRPQHALLENVPGLISKPYFRTILRQIAESGYDCQWGVLGADDIGACQHRKRLFLLLADARLPEPSRRNEVEEGCEGETLHELTSCRSNVANPKGQQDRRVQSSRLQPHISTGCANVADTNGQGLQGMPQAEFKVLSGKTKAPERRESSRAMSKKRIWWAIEPNVGRVAHGVAHRVDRLKAIGNGEVPAVVKTIWRLMAQ